MLSVWWSPEVGALEATSALDIRMGREKEHGRGGVVTKREALGVKIKNPREKHTSDHRFPAYSAITILNNLRCLMFGR